MRIALPSFAMLAMLLAAVPAAAKAASWQSYADCSVSYRIDSMDAQLNKTRSNSMKAMIHDQAKDYRDAAVKTYGAMKKTGHGAAMKVVDGYMARRGHHFTMMMKSGKLDDFIDHCPQIPSAPQ